MCSGGIPGVDASIPAAKNMTSKEVDVLTLSCSAALPRTRAPLVKDKECQERDTVKGSSQPLSSPSYQGASDVHGVPQGHGIAVSPDGSKHIGNWRRGVLSGLGALILPWGDKYMGEWKDGLAHGVGVHLSKGGLRYEGQWLHDARHVLLPYYTFCSISVILGA